MKKINVVSRTGAHVNFSCPIEFAKELKEYCENNSINMSAFIRAALISAMKK